MRIWPLLRGRLVFAAIALFALTASPACRSKSTSGSADQAASTGSEPGAAGKRTLVINGNTSDPAPKAAMEALIAAFEAENPDIEVKLNLSDHEGYKTAVRNFLTSEAPDVITWNAGNRMRAFVDRNLLEDVSDIWRDGKLAEAMASTLGSLTVAGKQYGVPYTYYHWGIYYRKDLFEQHGLAAPATWDELLAVCKTLKEKGITPFTIGTKALWPAAGWFDYLNLRENGLDFHIALMDGKVPYTDARVKAVFTRWRELVDAGYFLANHATYSWQEAQAFLYNGQAAMYLMGNFLVANLPPEVSGKMGFFRFPTINPGVGTFEDAPTDTLHIPAKARNKADARKFLAFAARAESQTAINQTLKQLPPHRDAKPVADDVFLAAGMELLQKAQDLAQFYDRDTDPEMAKLGMEGFQEFMVKPDRLDDILGRLEKARARIFK